MANDQAGSDLPWVLQGIQPYQPNYLSPYLVR